MSNPFDPSSQKPAEKNEDKKMSDQQLNAVVGGLNEAEYLWDALKKNISP